GILEGEGETRSSLEPAGRPFPTRLLTVSDPGLILPESACRWPQVFHTQAIRLCPMTLFNPVFNCQTPIVIRRLKTQAAKKMRNAECGIGNQFKSYFFRIPHSAFRKPVAWATNAITEGRARFRIGTQWFSRSGCWNRRASSGERAIAA